MTEGTNMMNLKWPGALVSVKWLADHAGDPDLVLLDASLKPVTAGGANSNDRDDGLRIPGTRIFDFDKKICDTASDLPHMMPAPDVFEREVRALGVNRDSIVVVYDRIGVYSSPRAWWMFKAMGHDAVSVLDGGLPAWSRAGLPVEPFGNSAASVGNFTARPRPGFFCDAARVADALQERDCKVLDARSENRFFGREPEPRPGLRSGHMPNALNLPFGAVLRNGLLLPREPLAELFASRVGHLKKLIFSCGSGVTSCVLALAADLAGYSEISVYDGSWSEWGQTSERPVVQD